MGQDFNRLKSAYHWLSAEQLRAALGYSLVYPQEIDQLIDQNESWDERKIEERYPFLSPHS